MLPNSEKLVSIKETNEVSTEDPSKKEYTFTANLLSPGGKTSSARVVRTGVRDSTPAKDSDPEGFRRHKIKQGNAMRSLRNELEKAAPKTVSGNASATQEKDNVQKYKTYKKQQGSQMATSG